MAQRVNESIEVAAPKERVFSYWANFENFPEFMQHIEEVRSTGEDTTHWKVNGPLGKSVEFDARTTRKDPDGGIGWDTMEGQVLTSGEVHFEELDGNRTKVEVTMNYSDPPGGAVGEKVAGILSDPQKSMQEDLQHFKRIAENDSFGDSSR